MNQLRRLSKVLAMSPREVAARITYAGYLQWERRMHRRGTLARPGRLRGALVTDLSRSDQWAERLLGRDRGAFFFAGVSDAAAGRTRFAGRYGTELMKARQVADDALRHEIVVFGHRFALGERVDWHRDPVTGADWPRTYHADVPVHGGNRGYGDVKHVWEVNRHQYLIDLAKIAVLDESTVHGRELQALVEHFLRQVPYGTGTAWACALEPAFRAWSWLWAYHLVHSDVALPPAFHLEWLTGFYDHGRFLFRHLETYSSPYNHLVGEASALFALGLLFPEFIESERWVARGKHVLETTVKAQFYVDGGSVEQSTFYHHATLGFYLLAAVLGRRNGEDLSPAVWQAIERGIAFSMSLIQPDGRVPRLGGADDGKPIRLEHLPFFDFRSYQAIGAALFSRPDFKFAAGRFWEDAYWVLGQEGADCFDAIQPRVPALATALPASGYYVVRSDWGDEADYLCFDCGPQAAGLRRDDVPSAAHGHADCLSVVAGLGGREILVDPGFFCYNGEPEWEVHFRKTLAHNTVVVDGLDQAQHVSKMAWTRTYAPRTEGWSPDGRLAWTRGSHDGFARLHHPVVHRRTAWLRPDGYVVLFDEVTGDGQHVVDLNFQFASGQVNEAKNSNQVVFDGRYQLCWVANMPLKLSIARGGPGPADGWIAPSLGVLLPAPRLTLTGELTAGRLAVVTVLADLSRASVRTTERADDGIALAVDGTAADWRDDILAALHGPIGSPDVETDAPLVAMRWRGDSLAEASQAGGSRIVVADRLRGRSRPAVETR